MRKIINKRKLVGSERYFEICQEEYTTKSGQVTWQYETNGDGRGGSEVVGKMERGTD